MLISTDRVCSDLMYKANQTTQPDNATIAEISNITMFGSFIDDTVRCFGINYILG